MNKELALRALAYLRTHYNNNDETTICKEDIDAIDFILEENKKLTDLINELEKWLNYEIYCNFNKEMTKGYQDTLDKLQELKGDGK